MFDQTVESKTKGWKNNKLIQNNHLYRSSLKNHTLNELILTPQSFNSDFFQSKYMHSNGTSGTIWSRNMAGDGIFLKWKSKQLVKLYDHLVFLVAVFDFIFSHKNTLYEEDRLIKHP